MPDALIVTLPQPLADDVRAAAEARGLSPEEFVRLLLTADLATGDGLALEGAAFELADDVAAAEAFDRDGVAIPGDEVIPWLRSIGSDQELPRPRPRKLK